MLLNKHNDQICKALNLEPDLTTWIQEWNIRTVTKIVIIIANQQTNSPVKW